jgi:hypothetical protein
MSIEKLKNIAMGNSQDIPSAKEEFLKSQNNQSEQIISELGHLSPTERYESWEKQIGNTLQDPEYRWATKEKLWPTDSFKTDVTQSIDFDLKTQRSVRDTNSYFQKEYSKWPGWLQDHYKEPAEKTIPYLEQEELSDARINNKLSTRNILSNSLNTLEFSGTQSVAAHAADISSALLMGHENLHTNSEGRISVAVDGQLSPIYAMKNDTPTSPLQEIILLRDTSKQIEDIIRPSVTAQQNDLKAGVRAKNRKLFDALKTDEHGDLEEFEDDIIYNAAMDELDQVGTAVEGIKNLVASRDSGNPWDTLAKYVHKSYKFSQLVERRRLT